LRAAAGRQSHGRAIAIETVADEARLGLAKKINS
jgi:hypothetical protein